jgi:hypothetical protein
MGAPAVLVAASWLAGQLLDGHVHKVHNGGRLVHCAGVVVEVVVRRAGDKEADVEVWFFSEKDRWLPPQNRTVRLRVAKGPPLTLQLDGDHFEGKITSPTDDWTIPLEVEVVQAGRTSRARLTWTALDDRSGFDDRRTIERRPPGGRIRKE